MSQESDLLVLGAGAKGTAIAIKAHVLNSLGLGPIRVTIVDAGGSAAAWLDGDGVTSSREILAITPMKDIGFPYQGAHSFGRHGRAVDRAAADFSWQSYLIEEGRYAQWIDAGSPSVQRRVYGAYLGWALDRATDGVRLVHGAVTGLSITTHDRWVVEVEEGGSTCSHECSAFALTGQGAPRVLAHDVEAASRILDCDRERSRINRTPPEESSDIAIVGGGESALSCIEFVRAVRPDAELTIYTAGLPMSRVESFLENRVFSNPDTVGWTSLSAETRRDFIVRSDRAVFGPDRVAAFAFDGRCSFLAARVTHVASDGGGRSVLVDYTSPGGDGVGRHDFVINCTGFSLVEQLRDLLSPLAQIEMDRRTDGRWSGANQEELLVGRALELAGMTPRLHVPGLAAISQGPGFSTLGSLGLLADRVLEPLFADAQTLALECEEDAAESRERLRPLRSYVSS